MVDPVLVVCGKNGMVADQDTVDVRVVAPEVQGLEGAHFFLLSRFLDLIGQACLSSEGSKDFL